MKKIFFLYIFIITPVLLYAQCGGSPNFPGVSSSNPIQVGNLNASSPYTDTKNNSPSNCFGNTNQGQPSDDIWYKFTLLTNGEVYLSHCGSSFDTFMVLYNSNVTMVSYNDNNESFCDGPAAGIKITLAAGTYFLVSEGKGSASGDIFTTISLTPINYSDPTGDVPYVSKNYITTYSPRQVYPATESLNNKTPAQVMKSTQYYNGLGRLMQTVQVKGSPTLRDVVQPVIYNSYGREAVKYLPYAAATSQSDGAYKILPIRDVKSFYGNPGGAEWNAPGVTASSTPFSQSVYEYSPLERLLTQGAPGEDWKIGSGHEIEMGYGFNANQEILQFFISIGGQLMAPAFWEKATLSLSLTINEDGMRTKTFTDKQYQERIYAKRMENKDIMDPAGQSSSYWMDTYYVYNQKGELAFVLPPEFIKQYIGYSSNGETYLLFPFGDPSQTLLDKLAFQYKYDDKGRLVAKHLPGKDWELIVYNQMDLPVLTQDGNSRSLNQWLFIKYDVYGRGIANGLTTIPPQNLAGNSIFEKRNSLQTIADQYNLTHKEYESPTTIASVITGYTNASYPVDNLILNTLSYYDNYQFLVSENMTLPVSTSLSEVISKTARGMQTGIKVRVLGTEQWVVTVHGYNTKGQLVWEKKSNPYLSSINLVENKYNFTGEVTQTRTTHNKANNPDIVTLDKFDYDHQGRMTKYMQCLNGTCNSFVIEGNNPGQELIAGNQYNEIGQLISKKVGNTITNPLQTIGYTYNIRGWLTSINDPENLGDELFGMKIGYNDLLTTNANPNFNGNISSILWSSSNDNVKRMYGFKYDGANRLKKADYNTSIFFSLQNFDEGIHTSTPSGIVYDYNGNILRLARYGLIGSSSYGLMDNLTYTYNGNQLSRVEDQITAANINDQEFKDVNTIGDDYSYDVNGNMIMDLNKGLTPGSIQYNHLNLPTEITKGNQKIKYIYDANGQKQEKQLLVSGVVQTLTQYVDGFVYKNNIFEYFTHAEGYVRKETNGAYTYIFQYKDHLGNVRLSYADGNNDAAVYTTSTPIFFDGFETSSGWNSVGAMFGGAISSYDANPKKSGNLSGKIEKLTAGELYVHSNTWIPVNNAVDTEYIFSGWVYSDNPGAELFLVGKVAGETAYNTVNYSVGTSVKNQWYYLEKKVLVPKEIVTINLRLDNNGGGNVWFDDVSIRRVNLVGTSEIVEVNSYYPFGLEHKLNSASTSTNFGQKIKYNGKELQDELGFNIYDFGARNYDPAIGRWFNIDPKAEKYYSVSQYNYCLNNPIFFVDPNGKEIKIGEGIYSYVKDRDYSKLEEGFERDTYLAIDKLYSSGAMNITFGEGESAKTVNVLDALINDKENNINVVETKKSSDYDFKKNELSFNSRKGSGFFLDNTKPMGPDNMGLMSPASILGHEFLHGYNDLFTNDDFEKRRKDTSTRGTITNAEGVDVSYPNAEEAYTTKLSNQINRAMGDDERADYAIIPFQAASPVSTELSDKYKKRQ